jgi:hypothetical protein
VSSRLELKGAFREPLRWRSIGRAALWILLLTHLPIPREVGSRHLTARYIKHSGASCILSTDTSPGGEVCALIITLPGKLGSEPTVRELRFYGLLFFLLYPGHQDSFTLLPEQCRAIDSKFYLKAVPHPLSFRTPESLAEYEAGRAIEETDFGK